jgi:hypothetical protein
MSRFGIEASLELVTSRFGIEASLELVTSRFGIEASLELVTSPPDIEASRSETGTSQFDIEASQPAGPMLR